MFFQEANDFKIELISKNRFFARGPFIDRLQMYLEYVGTEQSPFKERNILGNAKIYRARKCDLSFVSNRIYSNQFVPEEEDFYGYNSKDSFVPPLDISTPDGRVNPKYIRYLYAAEDKYTALLEIKPSLNTHVSIAEIIILQPLFLLDMTDYMWKQHNLEAVAFLHMLHTFFSSPYTGELKDYLPSQYITEYIKNWSNNKYDGIRFKSSLNSKGKNLTIFNYDGKCKPISSRIYSVDHINYYASNTKPDEEDTISSD